MVLEFESYLTQAKRWPSEGRHIMAQYDDESVVVYQAYNLRIGQFAAQNGYFGGDFRLGRMTWVKPNFLWMMFRSGWGAKSDQEVTLAVRLKRTAFDEILASAVASSHRASPYEDANEWKTALKRSEVRLQWDPDHSPDGAKETRRAIQLGIRGDLAIKYSREWILQIVDISDFVFEQREHSSRGNWARLQTPKEKPYPVQDETVRRTLGLTPLTNA